MTLYVLIGLAWVMVLLASLTLRVLREREPEQQWRLLLLAAAAPFLLYPVTTVCRALLGQVAARIPLLDTPWLLVALAGIGAVVALGRSAAIVRRQRALLAACARPEPDTAARLETHLRRLSRAAGLRQVPRVLLYPRGAYVCALGVRRPTIVLSRGLLTSLGDEEVEAVLGHEVAHVRQRDYLLNWLGVLVRSALFFVPPGPLAWRVLAEVRERRADRLAARYSGNPLALATALIKVWRHGAARPLAAWAPGFLERAGDLEARVRRLLDPEPPARGLWRSSLGAGVLIGSFLVLQTTVEGGTHLMARVSPALAAWERCCDPKVSPVPHCAVPPRASLPIDTIACSMASERGAMWTS
jgi:Zn-dependent protease with chaperone function